MRVGEFIPQMERPADPRRDRRRPGLPADHVRPGQEGDRGRAARRPGSSSRSSTTPTQYGAIDNLFGVYAYAIQIYADFSGYTDIAIGLALLLGIRFPQNFNSPYIATTLQDFWRRWHMTLSRWLRDYLYIGLGGNRKGETRTCINLFLTMFLGGLWHGASWTFVVWGTIHGVGLVLERIWMLRRERAGLGAPGPAGRVVGWLITFNVVCLAWIFFRAPTFSVAFDVIHQILTGWGTPVELVTPLLLAVIGLMLAAQWVPQRSDGRADPPLLLPPAAGAGRSPGRGILPVGRAGPPGRRRVHLLPVLMPNPTDQRRRPKRLPNGDRPLAAAQVIVVGAIALVLAALLNAETLVSTFDRMPHSSAVRGVGLTFARPVLDVSRALRFDRAGERVDALRGSDQGGEGSFTDLPTTTTAAALGIGRAARPGRPHLRPHERRGGDRPAGGREPPPARATDGRQPRRPLHHRRLRRRQHRARACSAWPARPGS